MVKGKHILRLKIYQQSTLVLKISTSSKNNNW